MTAKKKRVKFAKFLRRYCKLTLPESVAVAKYSLAGCYGYGGEPYGVVERHVQLCNEGCCWGYKPYVTLKSGEMVSLASLAAEFSCPHPR